MDLLLVGGHHHHHFSPTAVSDPSFEKEKVGLVDLGNLQRPGIDYNESSSSVMRVECLRTLLALTLTD